jgi:hypothetical protein
MRNIALQFLCPDGGIGRRSRLKICRSQGCAGSIPVPGTYLEKEALLAVALKVFFILRGATGDYITQLNT